MSELIFLMISNLFSSVIGVLTYIAIGYGLFHMAGSLGFKHSWLAWVPFGQDYILGAVADESCKRRDGRTTDYRKKLLGLQIALVPLCVLLILMLIVYLAFLITSGVKQKSYTADIVSRPELAERATVSPALAIIPGILTIVVAVLLMIHIIFRFIALHKIYQLFAPESAALFLLLSIFISPATLILFFVLAKRAPALDAPTTEASHPNFPFGSS